MKNRRQIRKKPNRLAAFIPARVSNETVLRMLDRMRRWGRRLGRRGRFAGNRAKNEAAFSDHEAAIRAAGGFIEDQNRYTDLRLGRSTIQYAGCEIIAVYNVIRALSGPDAVSFPELIEAFERDGIVLAGRFGTAPKALCDYLKQRGFAVGMTSREEEFERMAARYEALILTFYNDRNDIRSQIHTVAVVKNGRGFVAHNVNGSGRPSVPCESITELIRRINGGRARGIALIGVSCGTGGASG